jgi:hypothetical protein
VTEKEAKDPEPRYLIKAKYEAQRIANGEDPYTYADVPTLNWDPDYEEGELDFWCSDYDKVTIKSNANRGELDAQENQD